MLLVILSVFVASVSAVQDSRCVQYSAGAKAITLQHRTDCRKFYICDIDGSAQEMRCPDNLYYSVEEGVCSYDASACFGGENIVDEEPPKHESPIIIDNGFKNEQEFLLMACLNQPSGVTLPLADDCSSYVVCLQRRPIILTCPEGLAYDRSNNKCEFKEIADCKAHKTPTLVDEPKDMNIVVNPEPQPLDAESSKPVWNVPNLPLQKPNEPNWPMPELPIVPLPDVPFQLQEKPIPEPVVPREQEFMPYGPVTYSDPRCLQRFDPDNPVLFRNAKDCTKYYVCVGNNAIEKRCPNGQHWSVEHGWCDFPQRANCIVQ
ncbi:uncharacterized protein LOC134226185 [Armigeres subalbatus]|uniref:uncharacterized protein LOC134226185 n=1 Tax=Armigeres subalbatus TaxID=124917 RepID=UPI002ED5D394